MVLPKVADCTTAVGAEVAGVPSPAPLLAVSCTSIVPPTSSEVGTYVWAVALEIGRQLMPMLSHCSHW